MTAIFPLFESDIATLADPTKVSMPRNRAVAFVNAAQGARYKEWYIDYFDRNKKRF